MTMLEKVARAIRRGRFERCGRAAVFDETLPLTQNEMDDARAALEAIREPDDDFFRETLVPDHYRTLDDARLEIAEARDTFTAMIDHILNTDGKG